MKLTHLTHQLASTSISISIRFLCPRVGLAGFIVRDVDMFEAVTGRLDS